jgi:hypothetical protein
VKETSDSKCGDAAQRQYARGIEASSNEEAGVAASVFHKWNRNEKQWIDAQPEDSRQAQRREIAHTKKEERYHGQL